MGLSQANVNRLASILTQVNKLRDSLVVELDRFAKATTNGEIQDERDVADGAYLCKVVGETLDYLRKDCERTRKSASQWACEQWTIKELSGVVKGPIRGQLTTATTKITSVVQVPKKDTAEYQDLCRALGISPDVEAKDVFHVHWPGIIAYCSDLIARGLPLPAGIDKRLVKTDKGLEFLEAKDMDLAFRKAKD